MQQGSDPLLSFNSLRGASELVADDDKSFVASSSCKCVAASIRLTDRVVRKEFADGDATVARRKKPAAAGQVHPSKVWHPDPGWLEFEPQLQAAMIIGNQSPPVLTEQHVMTVELARVMLDLLHAVDGWAWQDPTGPRHL